MTARFETYERSDGEFGWRLRAGNGETIASGEGHRDRRDAERAARAVLDAVTYLVLDAGSEELVEVYQT